MSDPPPKKRPRRAAAVLLGLGLPALAEAMLRVLNVAPPDTPLRELYYRPPPVFVREGEVLRTSVHARKYFLDQSFPAAKAPGTLRIFVAGGSVAMGFPLESIYGPAQLLKAGLDALDPGRSHEVINAGGFGYNSSRVERVAKEIAQYQPDAIIVMTGHNEFLGKRFFHEAGRAGPLYRLRLYRLLAGLISAARGEEDDVQWEGHVVNARERKLVLADFARNLGRIAEACEKSGVKLILVTCPANIQDFRPYGPSCMPREDQEKIEREMDRKDGDRESVQHKLRQRKERCPDDAVVSYEEALLVFRQEGGGLNRKGQALAANALFQRACDDDAIPVRALAASNEQVLEMAWQLRAALADPAAIFNDRRIGSLPLVDPRLFFDHCHLKQPGQELLAYEMIRVLADAGLIPAGADWRSEVRQAWKVIDSSIAKRDLAESYYRIGYESGVNMGRVFRGLDYAGRALELDPAHVKARMLMERLKPLAAGRYRMTGD
ncbi:MAG TPA: hypothetical protein VM658_14955 [bacterium]|nr:hypothetical protein [bacterium]